MSTIIIQVILFNTVLHSEGNGVCLEDAPSASAIETDPTALAGLTFDADEQCQAQMGSNFSFCTDFLNVSYV